MIKPKGPVIVLLAFLALGKAVELAGRWLGVLTPQHQQLGANILYLSGLLAGGVYAVAAALREGNLIAACFSFPGSEIEQPHLRRLHGNFSAFIAVMWATCVLGLLLELHYRKP
ncbi:MAG TPA: hypothetical protein PLL10_01435 [Elusimicrobiales bacterium]|nr:hypothetical protein [Elusimicrobiales bacterium]